jgi:glycosyltransferase involved in cell wall biosynthesis
MSEKLLSIIIPCYNTQEFVEEAVKSALNQTYPNKEIIVVNDGSTDDSLKVLEQFGDQIKIITKCNEGISAARNTGILSSVGDYIMFLDADDIMSPHSAESKISILEAFPEAGMVIGNHQILTESGLKTTHYWHEEYNVPMVKNAFKLLFDLGVYTVDPIYRREVFASCGLYDTYLSSVEDTEFYLRVATKYAIAFDVEPHSYYRRFEGANTLSKNYLHTYLNVQKMLKKMSTVADLNIVGVPFSRLALKKNITTYSVSVLQTLRWSSFCERLNAYGRITRLNPAFPLIAVAARLSQIPKKVSSLIAGNQPRIVNTTNDKAKNEVC